jgi:retron-type reverse transcriptase
MKRIGNLYNRIYDMDNLLLADRLAAKGKNKQKGVIRHQANQSENLSQLQAILAAKTYRTSQYTTFKIYEPKERVVYRLPYFPDRIVHHAIMNVLEPVFLASFTADTYSSIQGRGIHGAARKLKQALKDESETVYCLKLDIRKFYPSVDHDILKELLRRKFKDADLLTLLDEIIDSAEGLPIGNYLSQYLVNFYLTGFDHWLKEEKDVKYYFRYADDMVILGPDKVGLHDLLSDIRSYLYSRLRLIVKSNYQVFPVDARGIDFLGYRFYHGYTLLRKSIKKNFARAVASGADSRSIASYRGWAKHCDSKNLVNKLQSC